MERHRPWITLLLALAVWLTALPVAANDGNVALLGQSFRLGPGERLDGDVAILAGNAEIAQGAVVTGALTLIGGSARVEGVIEGDAAVLAGSMVLGPQAWIKGDLVVMGALTRDPASRVDGSVVVGAERIQQLEEVRQTLQEQRVLPEALPATPATWRAELAWLWDLIRWLVGLLGLVILAAFVMAILPQALPHVSEVMGRAAPLSLAIGVLTVLAAGLLFPLLIIIIVGIPVALVLAIGLGLAVLCGWVAAAHLVGRKALGLLKTTPPSPLLGVALGVVTLALLARAPCLGGLFALAVACWGLGAVVLTRFGTSQNLIWSPFESLATTVGPPQGPAPAEADRDLPMGREAQSDAGTKRLSPWDLDDEASQ